uniref:Uncharacterized protein n=1 Tax=Romanomermis culicivorax TaxID=13658 RepID=A0A915L209_ROMCU
MAQKPVNLFTILIVCILYVKFFNGSTTSNSTEVQPINTTSCKNCAVSNATVVPFGEPVSGNNTTSPEISASKAIFTLHSSIPENLDPGKLSTDLMPLPTDSTGTTLTANSSRFITSSDSALLCDVKPRYLTFLVIYSLLISMLITGIRITGNDNYSINSLESESKMVADVSALNDDTTNVTTSEVRTEESTSHVTSYSKRNRRKFFDSAFVHPLGDVSPIIPTFKSLNEISGVDLYGVISAASTTGDVWGMSAPVETSEKKSGVDLSAVTSAASTTEDVWAMPAAVDTSEEKSGQLSKDV